MLSLVVQLARDLQGDFYPHFAPLFPVLVSLCLCHDAELIQVAICVISHTHTHTHTYTHTHTQNAFTALAHLFKFLWRHMLRDIDNVYRYRYYNFTFQTSYPSPYSFSLFLPPSLPSPPSFSLFLPPSL